MRVEWICLGCGFLVTFSQVNTTENMAVRTNISMKCPSCNRVVWGDRTEVKG